MTTFGTETYTYDADGERATRTVGSSTTKYIGGLYELDTSGTTRSLYQFGGKVIAQRTGSSLYYLHGDHLGSVSLSTSSGGTLLSSQDFKPWGEVRSGAVTETTMNYTGQRKDGTGLLYYRARYYDPVLSRFVSADSQVPSASSHMEVFYIEIDSIGSVNNQYHSILAHGFLFQVPSNARTSLEQSTGPSKAQALNRYSYVVNNPMLYTDPSGHDNLCGGPGCGGRVYNNSNKWVRVRGSISYENYMATHPECKSDPYHCTDKNPNDPHDQGPGGRQWRTPDGKEFVPTAEHPQPYPGCYVTGWFPLGPGQNTVDNLKMDDADDIAPLPGDSLDGHNGPNAQNPEGIKGEMYKVSNWDTAVIGPTGNINVIYKAPPCYSTCSARELGFFIWLFLPCGWQPFSDN